MVDGVAFMNYTMDKNMKSIDKSMPSAWLTLRANVSVLVSCVCVDRCCVLNSWGLAAADAWGLAAARVDVAPT